jgi:hypothetical protein
VTRGASTVARAALAGILALAPGPEASAHKFYASLAQVERTPQGRLEVSLRFFPDDLEAALRKASGRTVAVEDTREFARVFEPWLNAAFSLRAGRQTTAFKYAGIEVSVSAVWVYVEAPWTTPLDLSSMKNAMLFDLFPDQKNTVNFVEGKKRSSLVFSADKAEADRLMSSRPPAELR